MRPQANLSPFLATRGKHTSANKRSVLSSPVCNPIFGVPDRVFQFRFLFVRPWPFFAVEATSP